MFRAANGPSAHSNISSGLILRASSLVEGRVASFHALSSGMRFLIPVILRRLFPLWEKTGSDKLTGPFQRYHNPKASLSPGYLFTQEPVEKGGHKKNAGKNIYHQSVQYIQGSSFYLVSTYLQIMSSGCPIYNN